MKIRLVYCGKTKFSYLRTGEIEYLKRLKRFVKVEEIIIPEVKQKKGMTTDQVKEKEKSGLLKYLSSTSCNILLDDKGKHYQSVAFSKWLTHLEMLGKDITFFVGGPYGFHEDIYKLADHQLSLSKMTFSHQMIRLFLVEQIYRAYTIKNGLPYHHE